MGIGRLNQRKNELDIGGMNISGAFLKNILEFSNFVWRERCKRAGKAGSLENNRRILMKKLSIASIFVLSIFDLADIPGKVVFEGCTYNSW